VAGDPPGPGGARAGVGGIAAEAATRLPRPSVGLADEVDGLLGVVGAAGQPDEQPARVAAIGRGEELLVERRTGHARIFAWPVML
jgi:hypothetical protein